MPVTVSNTQTGSPAAPAAPVGATPSVSFQELLLSLRAPGSGNIPTLSPLASQTASTPTVGPRSANLVVRQGDCLSRICLAQLKGQGSSVSQRAVQAAVKDVAKANHIADPDRIRTGQVLDLSVLVSSASGGHPPGVSRATEDSKRWTSLAESAVALSSGFGVRKDPFTGQLKQHQGIDIAAPAGASIHAVAEGSVVFSGWKPGYGNTVIVRHEDGLESLYGHAAQLLVQVGERVACHTPIGAVGSTGRSTGAHLHFEVRRNGQAIDPSPLLKGAIQQIL